MYQKLSHKRLRVRRTNSSGAKAPSSIGYFVGAKAPTPKPIPNMISTSWLHEFQLTLVSCFLRDSHSEPLRIRGVTSISRGMRRKIEAALQGVPLRVR
jgi:hypothetical protein